MLLSQLIDSHLEHVYEGSFAMVPPLLLDGTMNTLYCLFVALQATAQQTNSTLGIT